MARLPKPLTPADCNLRGLPYMPLHGDRLIDSDLFFMTNGEEFKAALALWWASWKQTPAASLPTEPRVLAGLARVADLEKWERVREMALHGWVLCSDGRYYHPVIAELAMTAWEERQEHQQNKESETERKRREREERKGLFAALKAAGIHLAWNTSLSELRAKASEIGAEIVPDLSAGQVADGPAPVTAIEGTGKGKKKGSSLSASEPAGARAPKRQPEEQIPDDFPGAPDLALAEGWVDAAAVELSVGQQAKRFRNHAATKDRRERNWPAAWRQWIDIEIDRSPPAKAKPETVAPPAWNGPADVMKIVETAMTGAKARSYLGRCTWQEVPFRAVIAPNAFVAEQIIADAGAGLAAEDVQVLAREQVRAA